MGNDSINNYEFGELEINDITVSHLHDKNGDMEELKRTQAVLSDLSNEFNKISLDISNVTEVISCSKKITELSPKVTNSKYFGQNHLIPFKKS